MNETIQTQLNHRTIRAFKDQPLTKEEVDLLVEVAQRTSTSMYLQAYSIISVTDPELKKALAAVSGQPYVATSGHYFLHVFHQVERPEEVAAKMALVREYAEFSRISWEVLKEYGEVIMPEAALETGKQYF